MTTGQILTNVWKKSKKYHEYDQKSSYEPKQCSALTLNHMCNFKNFF